MAKYSNLGIGGGFSSPQRRSGGKGWKTWLSVLAICALTAFFVWKGWFSEDDGKKKTEPSRHVKVSTSKPSGNARHAKKPTAPRKRDNAKSLALLQKAKDALAKEDYVAARDDVEKVLATCSKDSSIWSECVEILGKANTGIFSTDVPAPEKVSYTIKEGDNLISIAKRFGTTVAAIQKSNSLSPSNPTIYPGKTLRIMTAKWRVEVIKREFRLYLYNGDKLFKVYTVGVGRQGRTPSGVFKISGKSVEPDWYYNGKTIPYGNKENVLGTRWMALKPIKGTDTNLRGYGIHGTWQPESVGTQCSNGCIRMRNEDVEELFSIIPYGTEIVIKD